MPSSRPLPRCRSSTWSPRPPISRRSFSRPTVEPTMAVELLRRGVIDRLRSLAFWCAGVAGYIVLVSAIFPSLKGSADLDKLLKDYPDALKQLLGISGSGSLSSGAGFLDAELFGLML